VIREGAYADLCVFDAATVDEAATFARRSSLAKGIEAVIVNGTNRVARGQGNRGPARAGAAGDPPADQVVAVASY